MRSRASFLAILLATAASAAPANAAFPGTNGRIAYVRPGQGIWSIDPDGSGRLPVSRSDAPGAGCDSDPAFAPSGLTLAFQTCDPARHATVVATMSYAGVDRRTIVPSTHSFPAPGTPAFSPTGRRVVFADGASGSTHLVVAAADGTHRHRLKAVGYAPSWSVTRRMAFTVPLNRRTWCNSTELDDIYTLDSAFHHARRVTKNYGSYAPDWSPDGKRIAFTRDFAVDRGEADRLHHTPMDCKPQVRSASRYGPEVVVAKASGKGARRLTRAGGQDPAWSPDGKLIAFERSGWIWTMRADGTGKKRLTRGTEPTWQPLPAPYEDPPAS